jgi:hypothetical protein
MRVRDHVALASGAAALLYPRLGRAVAVPWAAGIFIDVDHYVWFMAHHRSLNPLNAVRVYNDAEAPQHGATRHLHNPAALSLILLLGKRRRRVGLPVAGAAFHVSLDIYHRARTAEAKAAALSRDRFVCRVCGARTDDVVAHVWRQPRILPSYRVEHFVSVCGDCHQAAHALGAVAIVRPRAAWEPYRRRVAQRAQEAARAGQL